MDYVLAALFMFVVIYIVGHALNNMLKGGKKEMTIITINGEKVEFNIKEKDIKLFGDCIHEALLGFQPYIDDRVKLIICNAEYRPCIYYDINHLSEQEHKELQTRIYLAVDKCNSLSQ